MRRAVAYAAFGGLLGGLLLGGGFLVLGDIPSGLVGRLGGGIRGLAGSGYLKAMLILPFALAGALAGSFCALVVVFASRELRHFSGSRARAFQIYRRPIVGVSVAGALIAVLVAGGVPVPPGIYPLLIDQGAVPTDARALDAASQWRAIEALQVEALSRHGGGMGAAFERVATGMFFRFLPAIQICALLVLGATLSSWSALAVATFLVSRRAGGEAAFWTLWLLAGGCFLAFVAFSGFGFAFSGFGTGSGSSVDLLPLVEMFLYSVVNTSVPAAWITLSAVVGNTLFGLAGVAGFQRSVLTGLLTFANAGAVLILGTTTRLTLLLNPPVPSARGGFDLPTPAWHILAYFEGHLVTPFLAFLPSAPLVTFGTATGVGLIFGGACHGMNATFVQPLRDGSRRRPDAGSC